MNFFFLESMRCSKNDEFGYGFEEVEGSRRFLGRNFDFFGEEIFVFVGDYRRVWLKGFGSKIGFDL